VWLDLESGTPSYETILATIAAAACRGVYLGLLLE
jgi:hypothetical protein